MDLWKIINAYNAKHVFHVGRNVIHILTYEAYLVIPRNHQRYVVHSYHIYIIHNGLDRMEAMICQKMC